MKILKKIISLVLIAIMVCFSLFLYKNKEDISSKIPIRLLVVKSSSMMPKLEINDVVVIKAYDMYEKDNIITFVDEDGNLITHRIVGLEDGLYVTKGDNNRYEDSLRIEKSRVLGKVIFILDTKTKNMLIIFANAIIVAYLIYLAKGKVNEKVN